MQSGYQYIVRQHAPFAQPLLSDFFFIVHAASAKAHADAHCPEQVHPGTVTVAQRSLAPCSPSSRSSPSIAKKTKKNIIIWSTAADALHAPAGRNEKNKEQIFNLIQ